MLTGLTHLHRTLAYLLFLVAMINLVLTFSRGRTDAKIAGIIDMLTRYGVRMGGGLTIVLGTVLWYVHGGYPLTTVWIWASLLMWVPVEILGKRMILAETALVADGGQGTMRMIFGAVGQLLCIAVIFGLMSVRP